MRKTLDDSKDKDDKIEVDINEVEMRLQNHKHHGCLLRTRKIMMN